MHKQDKKNGVAGAFLVLSMAVVPQAWANCPSGESSPIQAIETTVTEKNLVIEASPPCIGLVAIEVWDSRVDIQGGKIAMEGDWLTGMIIGQGSADFSARDTQIAITGESASAITLYPALYDGATPLGAVEFTRMDISTRGDYSRAVSAQGSGQDDHVLGLVLRDSRIVADGAWAHGVSASDNARVRLDTVVLDVAGRVGEDEDGDTLGVGIAAYRRSEVTARRSTIAVQNGVGVDLRDGGHVTLDDSHVTAAGSHDAHGLVFALSMVMDSNNGLGSGAASRAEVHGQSTVTAREGSAVWVESGADNVLDVVASKLQGDRLATLVKTERCSRRSCEALVGRLTLAARGADLSGSTRMADDTHLALRLHDQTRWEIHPTQAGDTRSDVSLLELADSTIRFDPRASGLVQTLVVGAGDLGGRTDVYRAKGDAHIHMNARLDAGGALAAQHTDRMIVNGDVSGTTWLTVTPVAASPGALTGEAAGDGISLVQVYGAAQSTSFALAGEYIPVDIYQYRLVAFDPDASDPGQRDQAGSSGKFWDFRLQSGLAPLATAGQGSDPDAAPLLVPQIPSYLAAPNALFQAGLLDIDTWHRRLGDAHDRTAAAAAPARDAFVRVYGGDYAWRAGAKRSTITDTRYRAVQAGGSFYGVPTRNGAWNFGMTASVGNLSFEPRGIDGSQKTQIKHWAIAPTATWQGTSGAYVDMLLAVGRFHGEVRTRQRGQTATLKGSSLAASIEAGVPYPVSDSVTLVPQAQAVIQSLKFARARDVDGFRVDLARQTQWTLRAGGEIRKVFAHATGTRSTTDATQVYAKVHVVHTPGGAGRARMGATRFAVHRAGTALQTGLGLDASLNQGRTLIYADITRQNRIGRAGAQGWAMNLGARIQF